MSDLTDIAARTQRFRDAVRAFTPPPPTRHAKLMPLKDGIIDLREKGASLRLTRELLATVGVAVSIDTIAQFLAEMSHNFRVGTTTSRCRSRTRFRSEHDPSATVAVSPANVAMIGKSPPSQPPS